MASLFSKPRYRLEFLTGVTIEAGRDNLQAKVDGYLISPCWQLADSSRSTTAR
jgi:hypothetical protein